MGNSVDDAQNTIIVLQQRMVALEETNALLLERIDELETDVETCSQQIHELQSTTNITNQEMEQLEVELEQLEGAFLSTNETVANHEADIQGLSGNH